MTEKIDKRTSGIITGPALIRVSMIVSECVSGTRGGVASCANKGVAPASRASTRNEIFMPRILLRSTERCWMQIYNSQTKHRLIYRVAKQIDRRQPSDERGKCGPVEFRDRAQRNFGDPAMCSARR